MAVVGGIIVAIVGLAFGCIALEAFAFGAVYNVATGTTNSAPNITFWQWVGIALVFNVFVKNSPQAFFGSNKTKKG